MTDSMNFGPEWLRNLSSDGSTTGGTGGAVRYQLSGYRYGREEMLGLYEKGFKPPASLSNFTTLYSEQPLVPLVLTPTTEEERMWQNRPPPINPSIRGSRGSSLERGGRGSRGRGAYNSYGRNVGYENTGGPGGGWGNGEQQEWSPRKDYNYRSASVDNWRRNQRPDEDDGWRSASTRGGGGGGGGGGSGGTTSAADKWGRSTSWRDGDKEDDRGGPQHDRSNRGSWHDGSGGRGGGHPQQRRGWEDDHPQPEWFTEQLGEGGGTFDSSGAYHGSDEEQEMREREQHRGGGTPGRKELQKSASQQNISPRHPPSLSSSKSSGSLSKQLENDIKEEMVLETSLKDVQDPKDRQDPPEKFKSESDRLNINSSDQKLSSRSDRRDNDDLPHHNVGSKNMNINGIISNQGLTNRVEEDFDRLQEDLVSKLVVEEESPKPTLPANISIPGVGVAPQQPPPNLVPPIQDKWYYQDPQGDLQGPFVSTEMAEWFKAGYFTLSLLVRRRCDKSFYSLGDLVTICNGGNPFLSTTVIPPLKEPPPPVKKDLLNLQYLQAQMALRQVAPRAYNPAEWANLSPMQRDLLSQHMMPQQHPQMSPVELQYLQQPPQQTPTNPLMHMISQMQQVNKLPGQTMSDQPQNSLPMQMDPLQALVQQMHSLQRIQPPGANIPGMGHPPNMPSENMMGMAGVHGALPGQNMGPANMAGLTGGIPGHSGPIPGPVSQTTLDGLNIPNDDNPINTLLRQLQSKNIQPSQQMESMWQQSQFVPPHTQSNNQWQQQSQQQQQQQHQQQPIPQPSQTQQPIQPQPNDPPLSMWDLPQTMPTPSIPKPNIPNEAAIPTPHQQPEEPPQQPKDKEASRKEKERDDRKKKEQEEKQLKKEAEEKRKQEQRRQELEKKAAEEKKRKEEERIKKELEKAKKEAEEKRQRELEEKRRLKEQRKAEEEARKKAEEQKKLEDQEKERQKEVEARRQVEMAKQSQENTTAKIGKIAPWSQSNVNSGPSLADIQKAEREKRLAEAIIQQQQRAQQIQEQQSIEKASIQLSWANKPIQPRQVKSLAEIQAEEQEKLAKQAAERLAQQQREKETNTSSVSTGIWQGQNLTWANTASQWSSNNSGFWDDVPSPKPISKPSNIVKSNSTSAMVAPPKQPQQQPPKQVKVKPKKEESLLTTTTTTSRNNNMNGPASEEFTQWCIRALSNVASTVDIPTFIGFLKDIESAAEVKDYCRDYLGESPAMHQFMAQFLEKRRSFKPKTNAHKDDMCSPAPAITPSSQHNCEFQEVKGKGKKCKKSKMTKVDARILGFNVTAAQDRINVGDRDYGDN